MTDPLYSAAEALKAVPGLKMKSDAQRREIARVVVEAWLAAVDTQRMQDLLVYGLAVSRDGERIDPANFKPTSIADLGKDDGEGPLPVYGEKAR